VRSRQRKGRKPNANVPSDEKLLNRKLSRNRGSIHVRARRKVFLYTHSVWLAIPLIANRATLKRNGEAKETHIIQWASDIGRFVSVRPMDPATKWKWEGVTDLMLPAGCPYFVMWWSHTARVTKKRSLAA